MPKSGPKSLPDDISPWEALENLARMALEELWLRVHDPDGASSVPHVNLTELNGVISAFKVIRTVHGARQGKSRSTENPPDDADTQHDALEFDPERLSRMAANLRREESRDGQEDAQT